VSGDTVTRFLKGCQFIFFSFVFLAQGGAVDKNIEALLSRGRGYSNSHYLPLTAQPLAATKVDLRRTICETPAAFPRKAPVNES
jgi:hypothetical protein